MEYEQKIITKLQKYPENNLTKDLIIPLFEKMGYLKVEFFGGLSEEGKDIVIWDEDKLGDIELYVAQVKHFKFSNIASDSKSLQTVINQLTACITKKLIYTDKTSHFPSKVFLISTHKIDTKTLLTRFDNEPYFKDSRIKIIDGIDLTKLLIKYTPDVIKNLIGLEFEISSKLKPKFNNEYLLKALGRRRIKDIKTIYTDIDFSLGKLSTKLFFKSTFNPKIETIALQKKEWENLKVLCYRISTEFSLSFLGSSIEELEKKNEPITLKYKNLENTLSMLSHKIQIDKASIDSYHKKRNLQTKVTLNIQNEIEKFKQELNQELKNTDLKEVQRDKIKEARKKDFEKISAKEIAETSALNRIKNEIDKLEKNIEAYEQKTNNINEEKSRLRYNIKIDGKKLADEITEKRKWIEERVVDFNKNNHTSITLTEFIQKCELIFDFVSVIFEKQNSIFSKCIGFDDKNNIRTEFETTRLRIYIEKVFDTGLNISVLGEAGAGKSTSLEMYAWNRKNSNKTIILAPLGYLVQESLSPKDIESGDVLEIILVKYLNRMEIPISISEFQQILLNGQVIFLLDGLDEAIKLMPKLPHHIKRLSERYDDIQIIISSRMHGSYLDEIPFFTVTLLPFTTNQRNTFINRWFENEEDSDIITTKIHQHLKENNSISEIICNPLLTTTLCVLAEHRLTLPKTEIKLYDERLRLFTGYYDNVKHIVTRISSTPNTLELMAQKLAFYLHCHNTRKENQEILKEQALRLLVNQFDKESISLAFKELMYPCEILIPMSSDGKYGFGHLRYQEHLVARELQKRSIKILPYLSQDWWEGPLLLFVRMNEDIEWLIREIGENGRIDLPIVKRMIAKRPRIEKERLQSLVEKYILLKTGELPEITPYTDFEIDYGGMNYESY